MRFKIYYSGCLRFKQPEYKKNYEKVKSIKLVDENGRDVLFSIYSELRAGQCAEKRWTWMDNFSTKIFCLDESIQVSAFNQPKC